METRKQAICAALWQWINQRPGLEFANYGNAASYRAEVRSIGRDLKEARELLRAVELRDSISADALIESARHAYSGRLTIEEVGGGAVTIQYCTGQYWPTEYRRAVCAVLAGALWGWLRDSMPAPDAYSVRCLDDAGNMGPATGKTWPTRDGAESYAATVAESRRAYVVELIRGKSPGDYLRDAFRKEFGRALANRWFN